VGSAGLAEATQPRQPLHHHHNTRSYLSTATDRHKHDGLKFLYFQTLLSFMSPYCYSPLSSRHNRIRLLRLLPHQDRNADIQCELFEYILDDSYSHLYETLSYVWGDANDKLPIFIHGNRFHVTVNLHAALSQLRNHSLERILWIDAICINQNDQLEKELQILSMATIYSQAYRVLVWLGAAADDSDLVFKEIRSFEGRISMSASDKEQFESAGLALLQRPWFRRIWVRDCAIIVLELDY
jgi:hypothetical protein